MSELMVSVGSKETNMGATGTISAGSGESISLQDDTLKYSRSDMCGNLGDAEEDAVACVVDDDDDDADEKLKITYDHRRFLSELEKNFRAVGTIRDITEFVSREPELERSLGKSGDMERTILHLISNRGFTKFARWKDIVRWLMGKYPVLYRVVDDLGSTVLATYSKNRLNSGRDQDSFIRFFVQEYPVQAADLVNCDRDKETIHRLAEKLLGFDCPEPFFQHLAERVILSKDREENTFLHIAARWNAHGERSNYQLKTVRRIVEGYPAALHSLNAAQQSAYRYRLDSYKGTQEGRPAGEDEISRFLKDKIMRLESRDDVTRLLYGDSQGLEIELDLLEMPNLHFTEQDLETMLGNVKFESILRYVRIPDLSLKDPSLKARKNTSSSDQPSTSKMLIFHLLKRKDVRKIIRVTVQDRDSPHRDEDIENLLRHFDVEIWDWEKLDICSEVIFEAAPNVRKLFLYSSGNNAVLRSWSSDDGLARLRKLTDVSLSIRQLPEGRRRTVHYVEEFMRRMERLPPMSLSYEVRTDNELVKQFAVTSRREPNSFLNNMVGFNDFIWNVHKRFDSQRGVRVAVIDDGVDLSCGEFSGSITMGVSFALHPENVGIRPYYLSSSGHGTLMAKLIHRVCPAVNLYVARIDVPPITRQPTLDSVIKAIGWAITNKVDVISMGWTIEITERNAHDRRHLEEIIRKASDDGILMFAAADDSGVPVALPSNIHGVFSVGAGTTTGHMAGCDFVLPGSDPGIKSLHDIDTENPGRENESRVAFATALASGLAALILYCADICELTTESRQKLHEASTMKSVLQRLTPGSKATKKFFDPELEKFHEEQRLQMLTRNIQELIDGVTM